MASIEGLGWTFDTVAETYQKLRPGYVKELYDKVFVLTAAGNTGNTKDLTAHGGKGDVLQLQNAVNGAYGQTADFNAGLRIHGLRTVDVQRNGVTDHHIGHFLRVGFFCGHIADKMSLTEHCHAVGKILDLVHFMGDYDN